MLLLAGLGGVSAQAATATLAAPGLICRHYPVETLQGLRNGDTRLVVVVQAFTPPTTGPAGLVVWLAPPGGPDVELARLAIHPRQAYQAYERARWQRFLISLAPNGGQLPEAMPLCIKVGFAVSVARGQGGVVFDLEVKPSD